MAADKDKAFKMRFRHLDGDLGPFPFQESSSVLSMKSQIWEEWPNEGNLADKKPESVQHLRILYQGKILQDVLTISDLKQLPGEIVPDRLVTLHLVVAPPGQLTGSTSRRKSNETTDSTCCCVQ